MWKMTESPLEKEMLDYIYRNKTSALIEASMMTGAIPAGANEQEVSAVEKAAGNIGLAFQIQDDILDVTSTLEVLGKPIGSDEKNHKATYVSFEGLEKAREDVALYTNSAVARMDSLVVKNEIFERTAALLNFQGKIRTLRRKDGDSLWNIRKKVRNRGTRYGIRKDKSTE